MIRPATGDHLQFKKFRLREACLELVYAKFDFREAGAGEIARALLFHPNG